MSPKGIGYRHRKVFVRTGYNSKIVIKVGSDNMSYTRGIDSSHLTDADAITIAMQILEIVRGHQENAK